MTSPFVVISMDSHTEAFIDLKEYLPKRFLGEYEEGLEAARFSLERGLGLARNMSAESGLDVITRGEAINASSGERQLVYEEYAKPMPMDQRLAAIDQDGVAAEFITPFTGAYSVDLNNDFMHELTLAYNRYFQDYFSPAPYRFTAAASLHLRCGMATVLSEIADAYERGLRAVSLPGKVAHASPDLPHYNSTFYDPMWAALDERGMAAIYHIGLGPEKPLLRWQGSEPGWEILVEIEYGEAHLEALTYVLAGGVPERFPNLSIGYIESGADWIPPLLARLDAFAKATPGGLSYKMDLLPSEQWARQCFTAFAFDRRAMENRYQVGVDTLMWGSDYPHVEGSWPYSRKHLSEVLEGVPEDERQKIVAGNAARMLGFDLEKLSKTPAAQIPFG